MRFLLVLGFIEYLWEYFRLLSNYHNIYVMQIYVSFIFKYILLSILVSYIQFSIVIVIRKHVMAVLS